jgi:ABC-2 type transport system permease protein
MTNKVATRKPAPQWIRWLIRIRAFFSKEVQEIRRQPLLILSLIGGPLLVLMVFGISFSDGNPVLRTAIVVPESGISGISNEEIAAMVGLNFDVQEVTSDRAAAERRLHNGELDVVQVLPDDVLGALERGETSNIEFLSNAIDPMSEGWIQYLGYAEVNELNKLLLTQQTSTAQREALNVQIQINDTQEKLQQLNTEISQAQRDEILSDIGRLRESIGTLRERMPATGGTGQLDFAQLQEDTARLDENLGRVEQAVIDGRVEQEVEALRDTQRDLNVLEGFIQIFIDTPPDVVISPLRQSYVNIKGQAYSAVVYYAPGVLALLVQHTAITLGALALVRERNLGAFEVFRVSPVNMLQLLIGKYLGYTLFIALSTATLLLLLQLLGIPLLGDIGMFIGLLLLLTIASLGIGFLISSISGSDSQAIQLAMITLLMAIFFSGLFISLDSFSWPALILSAIVPMTHGISGFQDLMLRGLAPQPIVWIALSAIAIISFALVVYNTYRQLQRA